MIKALASLAAAAILAAPARAQMARGSVHQAPTWVSPVSAAVAAVGTDHIAGLGSVSLTALTTLAPDGRMPYAAKPALMEPLIRAVRAEGHTLQTFSALDTRAKLEVLAKAAAAAETEASAVAADALAAAAEPIREANREEVGRKIGAAHALNAYLTTTDAERLVAAQEALKAYDARRSELLQAFMKDLPGKLAAGEINAENLLQRDQDGWHAADESPVARYTTPTAFYKVRLARLGRVRLGPWTLEETAVLKETLDKPDVAAALTQERLTDPSLSAKRLAAELDAVETRARAWSKASPALAAAIRRFEAGTPRGTDLGVVAEYYDAALSGWNRDFTGQSRVAAWISKGGSGLPAWTEMKSLSTALKAGYHKNAVRGMLAFIGGLGFAALALGHLPGFVVGASLALTVAAFVWAFVNVWRRDGTSSALGYQSGAVESRVSRIHRNSTATDKPQA